MLDLSDNGGLKTIPAVVEEMSSLTKLNISRCGLTDLSERLVYFIMHFINYYISFSIFDRRRCEKKCL